MIYKPPVSESENETEKKKKKLTMKQIFEMKHCKCKGKKKCNLPKK